MTESKTIKSLLKSKKYEIFCLSCNSTDYIKDKDFVCLFGINGTHCWKYRDKRYYLEIEVLKQ